MVRLHTLCHAMLVTLLLGGSALLTLAAPATVLSVETGQPPRSQSQRLTPADLHYRGAFAYPAGDEWAYSGHALAYYPGGDAAGPADSYPGSLFAVGHAWYQQVGEITIPAPVVTTSFAALPQAIVVQAAGDITGGWLNHCTYIEGCEYREVAGLAYLANLDKLAWNLRDWYNVGGYDQDSLGWSDRTLANAQGVWHIGPRADAVFHNAQTSNYLLTAPTAFAAQYLGGKTLVAGNTRPAGAFGGSQGPTLYATAPWLDGNPPASGQDLAALALLYYPVVPDCVERDDTLCHFPNYRAADDWGGGAWIEAGDKTAVVIMGRKGLGANCYGIPGEDCQPSLCTSDKGWHADPYEPQLLFYDPADLAAVAAGAKAPWSVLPYTTYRPTQELLRPDCGILNAVAYDATRQLLYATESTAGPAAETVVHVWAIEVTPEQTPSPTPTATRTALPAPITTPAAPLFLPLITR